MVWIWWLVHNQWPDNPIQSQYHVKCLLNNGVRFILCISISKLIEFNKNRDIIFVGLLILPPVCTSCVSLLWSVKYSITIIRSITLQVPLLLIIINR